MSKPNIPPLSQEALEVVHDSATKHVSGRAHYIDDLPEPAGLLHIYIAQSPHAHAKMTHFDLSKVSQSDGVACVLSAQDIPGINDVAPITSGDPVFARETVNYAGQAIFAVAATDIYSARQAAAKAHIEYECLPAIVTLQEALAQESYISKSKQFLRGDPEQALKNSQYCVQGEIEIGGQEHFYLESQVAMAIPQEDQDIKLYSSTQNPTGIQHLCAQVLNLPAHAIQVEVRRMGGAFGGKESQAALFAAVAALVTHKTQRPSKVRLDRDDDMIMTGKRHDFLVRYQVGFTDQGVIQALKFETASRCGMSQDLSDSVNDRAMFHLDNAYFIEHILIISHRCRTHTVSNTAFRGFGGPQAVVAIERVIDEIAYALNKDALEIRQLNFYGTNQRNVTPYGTQLSDNIITPLTEQLITDSEYKSRLQAIKTFNQSNAFFKKGIALTPVKFGIAFTAHHLNQAGALIHIYSDGSIYVNHGGTEMGQGLLTKVAQVVAQEFQVDIKRIKISATLTDKVPNTSATAASSGSDLNGKAAQNAAQKLKQRLCEFAAKHYHTPIQQIHFRSAGVQIGTTQISFNQLIEQAYFHRVSLSATGFYKTPNLYFDEAAGHGHPFFYFVYGAAVSEVIIDTLTGEYQVIRADLLQDCGHSLNPAIDLGQVEGAFIQGMGWLTTEELVFDSAGHLLTHSPSTYKIPTCGDRPRTVHTTLWQQPNPEDTIYHSKAVGEPPFMLATSVLNALTMAVASLNNYQSCPQLNAPATAENILFACQKQTLSAAEAQGKRTCNQ